MPKQAAIITSGPSAVAKNAARQPNASASSCETRNESPTPIEKLPV
jgi:hypothetical protein